jgi:hypothetical protein
MILRRIGVWSTARIVGAIYAALGLIFGLFFAMFSVIGGLAAAASEDMPAMVGALFGVGAIVFLPLLYGCFGLIGGALSAAFYNLFSGMVGGIELELQPPVMSTRPL